MTSPSNFHGVSAVKRAAVALALCAFSISAMAQTKPAEPAKGANKGAAASKSVDPTKGTDPKLAKELAYCGVFFMNAPRFSENKQEAEMAAKKARNFVAASLLGLGVTQSSKLAEDSIAQLNKEMNTAMDKGNKDGQAAVKFLTTTRDRCEKSLNSAPARAAHDKGMTIARAQIEQRKREREAAGIPAQDPNAPSSGTMPSDPTLAPAPAQTPQSAPGSSNDQGFRLR